MSLTFPNPPTLGQQYSVSSGPTYTYDGTSWLVLNPAGQFSRQAFVATAGQTTFTISTGYIIGGIDVYRNGLKLPSSEFTATNGSTIVLTTAANLNDQIECVRLSQVTYPNTLLLSGGTMSGSLNGVTNLGVTTGITVGSTPSNWESTTKYLELGTSCGWIGTYNNSTLYIGNNTYLASGPAWKFKSSGYASLYAENAGNHIFYASSGTGITDNPIGWNTVMQIDPAGRVSMPYQQGCSGTLLTYASLNTPLGLGISYNQGSMGNSTTNRITVPIAGRYFIHMRQLTSATAGVYFGIYINGVLTKYSYNGGYMGDLQCTVILNLASNDYITFAYYNGGALGVAPATTWTDTHSEFSVYLLG